MKHIATLKIGSDRPVIQEIDSPLCHGAHTHIAQDICVMWDKDQRTLEFYRVQNDTDS